MGKVTGFIEVQRQKPASRPVAERVHDWREVTVPYEEAVLRDQTGRCMDCGIPFCHQGCPLGNLIPDWNDLVYRNRVGETYSVTYSPAHRWFYAPEMRAHEALLLKCCDTMTDGRARFMPHTSFIDPTTPPDAAPRESIELRTLVFHPV